MNIIRKKTSNEFLLFLTPSKILIGLCLLFVSGAVFAQDFDTRADSLEITESPESTLPEKPQFPDPKMVMRRSLTVPGWGQATNHQIWKVPIVYGLLGGLTYYSISLTKDYHDYRAAYYNRASGNDDFRFGPTPAYLASTNVNSLQNNRDFLRNRRDFIYITIGLAYLLNVVDAYVFAHLRSFDVSDDLSLSPAVKPDIFYATGVGNVPALTLSFNLSR